MTTESLKQTKSVEQLINKRIDGNIQSINWHSRYEETVYGVLIELRPDAERMHIHTLVLDLDDESLKVTDNGMWVPFDTASDLVQCVARATTGITNHEVRESDPLLMSDVNISGDMIMSRTLEDQYDGTKDNDRQNAMFALQRMFEQAGITPQDRFIRLEFGGKAPWTGEAHRQMRPPSEIRGNYGVEVNEHGNLAILDIDDMEQAPLDDLPETLEVQSPHGGKHLYYRLDDKERLEDIFGVENPHPSYGEFRVTDGYVVGPESSIVECKHGCCTKDDPGLYLPEGTQIAKVEADEIAPLLDRDEHNGGGDL